MGESYSGVVGAFPYAFRQSDSRLFRAYVVGGGLLALTLTAFFTFALIVTIASTTGIGGGTITFVRSVFVLLGFLVVAPLLAPVLFVARHHRRAGAEAGDDVRDDAHSDDTDAREAARYDAALGAAGAIYVLSLYLGAVASMPATFELDGEPTTRPEPSGVTAPLVEALYTVPEALSWSIPLAGAALLYLLHRRFS